MEESRQNDISSLFYHDKAKRCLAKRRKICVYIIFFEKKGKKVDGLKQLNKW